jgi:hypothetical protein
VVWGTYWALPIGFTLGQQLSSQTLQISFDDRPETSSHRRHTHIFKHISSYRKSQFDELHIYIRYGYPTYRSMGFDTAPWMARTKPSTSPVKTLYTYGGSRNFNNPCCTPHFDLSSGWSWSHCRNTFGWVFRAAQERWYSRLTRGLWKGHLNTVLRRVSVICSKKGRW